MTGSGIDPAVRDRILDRRTRALATRGLRVDDDEPLGDHLVFRLGARLHALRPELVETIRLTAWHPVPLLREPAAAVVLGVFGHGGRLYSLVELSRLLGFDDASDTPAGGKMLLLRHAARPVAVRVDHVFGLLPLVRAGDAVRMRPAGTAAAPDDRLVSLLHRERLHDALAALDTEAAAIISSDPSGA